MEHNEFKNFYKNNLLNITTINWKNVYDYWDNIADKNAEPNSIDKIRPKSLDHLKMHFEMLNNYYSRKKIEKNTLTGK